jgi:chitodextrinase
VLGYDVRRNGVLLPRVAAPSTTTTDAGLAASTTFAYVVTAVDRAGNVSGASAVASATTSACSNLAPIAHAGPDVFTQSLTAVAFSGASSVDPDGSIASWQWTFGDGASATGASPSHAYATAGVYTATLTVTDNGGLTASDSVVVNVTNRPPTANAGPDRSAMAGVAVGFSGTGTDLDGTIASYSWTFGDAGVGSGAVSSHVYTAAGTYNAKLTVRDNGGAQANDVAVATIGGIWSRAFGSPGEDRAQAVAVDSTGHVALAGYFSGTIDFGTGPVTSEHLPWLNADDYKDVVVARYDVAGAPVWVRRVGAEADDRAYAVATDSAGNVAVAGSVSNYVDFGNGVMTGTGGSNDAFVAMYAAADGAYLWSRRFGDSGSETAYGVAVDGAGSVVVVGTFFGTVDFGTGPLTAAGGTTDQDVFVAKYSSTGTPLWTKRFGTATAFEYVYGVAVDPAGDVLLTGAFAGSLSYGGTALASAGGYDVSLVKLAGATGAHVWSKRFGGTGDDYGNAVAVDPTGRIALAGYFRNTANFGGADLASAGGQDVFVTVFSPAGAHQWSRRAGAASDDSARAVALTPGGDVIVTGGFQGSVDFGGGALASSGPGDLFVARYGATGTHVWSRRFGGLGYQYGSGVAVGIPGNAIVAGYFQTSVDFGSGAFAAAGLYDGFVASLAP